MGKSLRVKTIVCVVVVVSGLHAGVIENRQQSRHRGVSKSSDTFPGSEEVKTDEIRYRNGSELASHLNLSLTPPAAVVRKAGNVEEGLDEIGDSVKSLISQFIPGAVDSDTPRRLFSQVGRGIQTRRESELSQAGILYDKNSLYKTPLGFPCDPRKHKLICALDEVSTTTSTRRPFKMRKDENSANRRKAKKKDEEEDAEGNELLIEKVRKLRRRNSVL